MKELPRLLEETPSDVERALLQAGMSYRTSRATWAKTLAALGLASSTTLVAGTASAGKLLPLAKFSGAKLLVAISVAAAVSAVPVGYRLLHRQGPSTAATRSLGPAFTEPAPTRPPGDPAIARKLELPQALPVAPGSVEPSRLTRASARGGASPVRLGQEVAALDAVRSALARGNAQGAIFLLDGYAQTCPHGRLELEADLLRMDALTKNGQSESARRLSTAFLKRHPTSVLTARARSYLEE